MLENIDKKKIILVLIILIIIIGGVALYFLKNNNEGYSNLEYEWENNSGNVSQNNMQANEIINEKQKIIVDISGQVISPGVVTLDEGSRVIDAINAAGGAKSEANLQKLI